MYSCFWLSHYQIDGCALVDEPTPLTTREFVAVFGHDSGFAWIKRFQNSSDHDPQLLDCEALSGFMVFSRPHLDVQWRRVVHQ
jgi:hypothetical protein